MHHVVVIVLGDIGRSPRMQYHSASLAKLETISHVSIFGFVGESCIRELTDSKKVTMERFKPFESKLIRKLSVLFPLIKGLHLLSGVFLFLWRLPRFQVILIQNPPCLPAILATLPFRLFHGVSVCLDWHNLGFSMFSDKLGPNHLMVYIAYAMERILSQCATHHVCVSRAMQSWLRSEFRLSEVCVLYDQPSAMFPRSGTPLSLRHALLLKLNMLDKELFPALDELSPLSLSLSTESEEDAESTSTMSSMTIQTQMISSYGTSSGDMEGEGEGDVSVSLRTDRAAVVVSSTSWTAEEDFSLLLEAAMILDQTLWVVILVTGKGAMKEAFEEEVRVKVGPRLRLVAIRTLWLEPEEYPLLMGLADVGVSLHASTSGLDLPMKVLDMFGSGVPVLALAFPCLHELIQHNHNGLIFTDANQLAEQLSRLLLADVDHPQEGSGSGGGRPGESESESELNVLRECVRREQRSWDEVWTRDMQPVIAAMVSQAERKGHGSWTQRGRGSGSGSGVWTSPMSVVVLVVCVAVAVGVGYMSSRWTYPS
eukprot:gene4887-9746_t